METSKSLRPQCRKETEKAASSAIFAFEINQDKLKLNGIHLKSFEFFDFLEKGLQSSAMLLSPEPLSKKPWLGDFLAQRILGLGNPRLHILTAATATSI